MNTDLAPADSTHHMKQMAEAQKRKAGFAMLPYFYRSQVTFEFELTEILFKSWLFAAHTSQIPEPGDFLLFEVGRDAVIVCRDLQGKLRALANTCRHRGTRICTHPGGNKKVFTCPYHGWVYELDGSLKFAREMDPLKNFDPSGYGLKRLRLIEFHGLIFVNGDPDASDFKQDLQILEPPLRGFDLARAKVIASQTYQVNANWKLALENYVECYHCATSHPAYSRLHTLKEPYERVRELNEAMLARSQEATGLVEAAQESYFPYSSANCPGGGGYHSRYALYDGFVTGSRDGGPVAPLMGGYKGYDGGAGDFQLGPLCFMLGYPDHCVLYRFTPRARDLTDMEVVWTVREDAVEGKDYQTDEVTWLWHQTTLEDQRLIERNAQGVNSHFFEPGPFHPEYESLLVQFVEWYLDRLTQGLG